MKKLKELTQTIGERPQTPTGKLSKSELKVMWHLWHRYRKFNQTRRNVDK